MLLKDFIEISFFWGEAKFYESWKLAPTNKDLEEMDYERGFTINMSWHEESVCHTCAIFQNNSSGYNQDSS